MKARADIATTEARRILMRLAKHWAHHFAVTQEADEADIRFDDSSACRLEVKADGLHVSIEASSENALAELEQIVAEHLQRMAKDGLSVSWNRDG